MKGKGSHDEEARRNFKKFYGRGPSKKGTAEFTMPKALTCLGEMRSISYYSTKHSAVKKVRAFEHFTDGAVKIYLHPNRRWLLISGGKFRVTDWMRG